MNFLRLLTVGQSLKWTRSNAGSYKLCPDNYFPKFGSPTRPAVSPAAAKPAPSAADLKFADSLFACSPAMTAATANATISHPPLKELANPAMSLPGAVSAVPGPLLETSAAVSRPAAEHPGTTRPERAPASPANTGPACGASGRWGLKRNPFYNSKGAEVLPRGEQRELSLDAVRVVRNDLSDDDLELVCAASKRLKEVAAADESGGTSITHWTRAAARVLSREKVFTTS